MAVVGMALVWSSGCSSSSEDAAPADPTSRENASAAKGAEAVQKRKCVDCHTANMSGATKAIVQPGVTDPRVELYPPNLTPDPETGIGPALEKQDPTRKGYTDDLLARAIRTGQDNEDLELCPQMKHFAEMSDFEVYSIVKYLRSLPPVKNKVLRSVCPPLKTKEEQTAAASK
ncbi:MAG TPA: c-type cytochrome [Labilithrix sp.]|nr:c-type cytochrome [Labilithrix sp.]